MRKSFKKNLKKVLLETKKGFIFAPAFGKKVIKIEIKEFIDILISSNYLGINNDKKHKQRHLLRSK